MWTCGLLKQNARQALGGKYWRCLLACLIAALLGGSNAFTIASGMNESGRETISSLTEPSVWTGNPPDLSNYPSEYIATVLWIVGAFAFIFALIGMVISYAYRAFVGNPVRIGLSRYLMENRQSRSHLGTIFSTFRRPYLNLVKAQIVTDLKILLGCILFLIPGIIWRYQYALVPYLLAENPYMSSRRVRELSRQIMQGEKWHLFLLQLSFIGWYLLCMFTFGFGILFLSPYYHATMAEFYAAMRSKAFAYGLSDSSELGGFVLYDADGNPQNAG